MPKEQSAASHAAWDSVTHFTLVPIFLINFIVAVVWAFRDPQHRLAIDLWLIVVAIALLLSAAKMRLYTLKVQDRIIRMEERLRVSALVGAEAAYGLSLRQLIALRFASDAELPVLVRKTVAEKLEPKQIKQSIMVWRPDYERV